MSYLAPSTSSLQFAERIGQGSISGESQRQSPQTPHIASIDMILDDNSLLNIFYLYRPAIFDGYGDYDVRIFEGRVYRDRWWYKLAHVCARWRNLIFGSASYLDLCLVCTYGTPVADMLAHSPPLPLVIDYFDKDSVITAEEEGIILALEQRDRVCHVHLRMPAPDLQKYIMAIDEEYPMLEYLGMEPTEENSTALMLPGTLQAPHLRHLALKGFVLPIGSRLLTTAMGLVTLALIVGHPSAYFPPNTLLRWISFMPQLETLRILHLFPIPNRGVGRQLMPMAHITLPNLRSFVFRGVSAYMEAVVRRITAPCLVKLRVSFFKQLTFSVPRFLQFMNTSENLRFDSAKIELSKDEVHVKVYPHEEAVMCALQIDVRCWHLDWQISSVAQIFNSLSQKLVAVENLILEHRVHSQSSEEHNEVNRIEWRKLLRSFSSLKNLRVDGLVKELSCSLRLEDGELPLELLPELQKLTYSGRNDTGDSIFTSFIDARQNAGRPVALVRLRLTTDDPIRDLNNYLQEVKAPENLTRFLMFSSQSWGPYNQTVYIVTYTFRGVIVGTGDGTTIAGAKRKAAAQAIEFFFRWGFPE